MDCVHHLFILLLSITLETGSSKRPADWLVTDVTISSSLTKTQHGSLLLSNGLIFREFQLSPDLYTVDYYDYGTQSSILRAVGPEAVVSLDGRAYHVGGILTDTPRAYLNRSIKYFYATSHFFVPLI